MTTYCFEMGLPPLSIIHNLCHMVGNYLVGYNHVIPLALITFVMMISSPFPMSKNLKDLVYS